MSIKSIWAPAWDIASVVAIKVLETVRTVSPFLTPAAINANLKASVPLPTPIQYLAAQKEAKSFSKPSTAGPPINLPVLRASLKTSVNSFSNSIWGVTISRNGTLLLLLIFYSPYESGRISCNDRVCRHILRHHTPGADNGIFANGYIAENYC